jgi:general secretion pathway protein N
MIKRIAAYLLLGLLAYAVFLVCTLPAERAAAMVRKQAPQLQLAGVTGTVWSGRAATLQYRTQRLSRFKWRLNPLALVLGRIEFDIAFDGEGRTGTATVARRFDGSLVLNEVAVRLPVAELGGPLSLTGLLEVKLDELTAKDGMIQSATGELHLLQAAVTEPVAQKLGDFSAKISTEAAGIKAQVRDEGGPLQLEGTLRLINDGSYQLHAKAVVRDPQQTMLQQVLRAAGRQEPDGRVALEYNGRL